jgi:hypothetical protein
MYFKDDDFRSRASTPRLRELGLLFPRCRSGILELAQFMPASEVCGPYLKMPTISGSEEGDSRLDGLLRHLDKQLLSASLQQQEKGGVEVVAVGQKWIDLCGSGAWRLIRNLLNPTPPTRTDISRHGLHVSLPLQHGILLL